MFGTPRTVAAVGLLTALVGCTSSDNFYWVIVSNPGGSFVGNGGGAVIVIRGSSSGSASAGATPRLLSVAGRDRKGDLVVHLPTESDAALLERTDALEVLTPILPRQAVTLDGARVVPHDEGAAALTIELHDASAVDPRGTGPGRLHLAATGNVLILEHAGGISIFGTAEHPEDAPPGSRIDLSGERPALSTPDGRVRLLYAPPHPPPAQRLSSGPVAGSVALLGPDGSTIAILPEDRVDLRGGAAGLFLTAEFPDGISERDPVPASILMPTHNRFLLKVEDR